MLGDKLLVLRYRADEKDRYLQDKEENEDIIDNTIDFDDEFVINIAIPQSEVRAAVSYFRDEIQRRINEAEKVREFASDHALLEQEKRFKKEADVYKICLRIFNRAFEAVI
ncbi:MAG: hypothetical protein DRM99_02445 [Thermoplasmata archaeon]|nr:MAG: hypothetical protein DRM99_02445 [Thermoplasmata archaeon]